MTKYCGARQKSPLGVIERSGKKVFLTNIFILLIVLFSASCFANSDVSNQYKEVYYKFDNGDSASIVCDEERSNCKFTVSVYGQSYSYTEKDINKVKEIGTIVPDRFELVRLSESERRFGVLLSYWCPTKTPSDRRPEVCLAMITIDGGIIKSVRRDGQICNVFSIE